MTEAYEGYICLLDRFCFVRVCYWPLAITERTRVVPSPLDDASIQN